MSIKEFWEEEPDLLWTYRKSYMDKIQLNEDLSNHNAWLNGLYVFNAVSVALYNMFGRKNGQPAQNYIQEPINFNKTEKQKAKEEQNKNEEQVKEALNRMKNALNNKKK